MFRTRPTAPHAPVYYELDLQTSSLPCWLFVPLNSTSGELINHRQKICLQIEPVLNMPLVQKHSYSNSFWSSTCHFCPYQPLSFFLNIVLPFIHVLFQPSRLRQQFLKKYMPELPNGTCLHIV